MIASKDITGVVLSGGKSSRMGEEKGLVKFNEKRLAEYSIFLLNGFCSEVIIIANSEDYKQFGLAVFSDIIKDSGPLAGLHTALSSTKTDWCACTSCDTPKMNKEVYEILIQHSKNKQVIVPKVNGKLHPLNGIYHKSCTSHFLKNLEQGNFKVREVIEGLKVEIVTLDSNFEKAFTNINTKKELEEEQ